MRGKKKKRRETSEFIKEVEMREEGEENEEQEMRNNKVPRQEDRQ